MVYKHSAILFTVKKNKKTWKNTLGKVTQA